MIEREHREKVIERLNISIHFDIKESISMDSFTRNNYNLNRSIVRVILSYYSVDTKLSAFSFLFAQHEKATFQLNIINRIPLN